MNSLFKRIFCVFICVLTAFSAVTAYAEEPQDLILSPVVLSYSIKNSSGSTKISKLRPNVTFSMTINIKDIKVKTSDIHSAEDIDVIKSLDSFSGTVKGVSLLSEGDKLLQYSVELTDCEWSGGDKSFGFMVGYTGGSDYSTCSVNVSECYEPVFHDDSDDPDIPVQEPLIKIMGIEPASPIKAGQTGEFKISLKNMSDTFAENILAEISPSEDVMLIEGTGVQEIPVLGSTEKTITVKFRAMDKINSQRQTFGVSIRYYYDNGTSLVPASASAQLMFSSEITVEKPAEKTYPVITAEFSLSESQIASDKEYTGVITLKNIGTADAKGVFADISCSEDLVITGGTGSSYTELLKINQQSKITVKFRTMSELNSYRQSISLALRYNFGEVGQESEGSKECSFLMFGKAELSEPLPIIESQPFEYSLEAGKTYRKPFTIVNKGNCDMKNVNVRITASDGLTVTSGNKSLYVDEIKSGKNKKVTVQFNTAAELTGAIQTLNIELEYFYEKAGAMTKGAASGTVSMNAAVSSAPVVRMRGTVLPKPISASNDYEYTVVFENSGDITVRDVYIDFTGSESLYLLDNTHSAYIEKIRPGASEKVKVKFRTLEKITSAKQSISASFKYSYGKDTSIASAEGSGTAVIIAEFEEETTFDASAAPNIIIKQYDAGADQIPAGEVFPLSLSFYNTSAVTPIENLVMTINASGDLSIYGGSSSFYYGSLGAASSADEEIQLRALPTAQTGTSSVTISFKYDYLTGGNRNTVTSDQTIYIPIYQPDKMTFSVNTPTYELYAGNEVYITLSYLNKGRAEASNVKAELIGDVGALSTEKIIGTVQPGGSGTADFIITPFMSGEVSFSILLTYEDSNFNELTQEIPVTLNVMEMNWGGGEMDFPFTMEAPIEDEGGGFPWWIVFAAGGAVIVAVVVIIIVAVHKKKKKKALAEEEIDWEDDLDEDKTKV